MFGSENIWVTTSTFWGHVTSSGTWPFDTYIPFPFFYRCSIVTDSLSLAVFGIMGFKHIGSRPFKVTWRRRSRDDSIFHMPFPIGAPLEPSLYLQAFSRYRLQTSKAMSSALSLNMRDITWPVPPIQNFGIFEFHTPTLPIHYDTFIWLRWRIRGVYSWDPQCYM